ncbi:ATP-dependent DNA helicase [Trichonephila clavipes]|nr:ATP-dependent DNA helicase [Trichonephila clavipes]
MIQNLMEYKREMVSLHIPFRNENAEILAEMKFVNMYNNDEDLLLQRRKEFESHLDIQKTIEICRSLRRENENDDSNQQEANKTTAEHLYNNPNADVNNDIYLATLHILGPIAKTRENLMSNEDFYQLMKMSNEKQKGLSIHVISHLLSSD